MFEKFSDRAKKVIQVGREEAKRLNHSSFGTEHLLYGILKTEDVPRSDPSGEGRQARQLDVWAQAHHCEPAAERQEPYDDSVHGADAQGPESGVR